MWVEINANTKEEVFSTLRDYTSAQSLTPRPYYQKLFLPQPALKPHLTQNPKP